jgi:hypothetical protein
LIIHQNENKNIQSHHQVLESRISSSNNQLENEKKFKIAVMLMAILINSRFSEGEYYKRPRDNHDVVPYSEDESTQRWETNRQGSHRPPGPPSASAIL